MLLARRIFFETWLPLVGALFYTFFKDDHSRPLLDHFPSFSYSFFLIFFFQGQFLRIRKNIRDEASQRVTDETHQGVASIKSALDELKDLVAGKLAPNEARVDTQLGEIETNPAIRPLGLGAEYFEPAAAAVRNNLYYSGALTAAQGFESVLRRIASDIIPNSSNRSLGFLIKELSSVIRSESLRKRLALLNRTRNTLVHETRPDEIDQDEAIELVEMFEEAANDLIITIIRSDRRPDLR